MFLIQGAVFEVNRVMGPGFLEAVYHECLGLEFAARGIPFRSTPQLVLAYKGAKLQQTYSPDFVCFDSIIVELKATRELVTAHRAQVLPAGDKPSRRVARQLRRRLTGDS